MMSSIEHERNTRSYQKRSTYLNFEDVCIAAVAANRSCFVKQSDILLAIPGRFLSLTKGNGVGVEFSGEACAFLQISPNPLSGTRARHRRPISALGEGAGREATAPGAASAAPFQPL